MENSFSPPQALRWALNAFAFTAVASIALQNIFLGIALLLFLAYQVTARRKFQWPQGAFPAWTLVFVSTFFLGALVGVDPATSFQTVHKYLVILLVFLVGAMPLGIQDISRAVQWMVRGALVCALYGILDGHFIQHLDRITSFSGDKMVFGGMLMVSLLLQVGRLKVSPRSILGWITAFFLGLALVMTQTRGAWLGSGLAFIFLTLRWDKKWALAGLAVIVSVYFLIPRTWQERLKGAVDYHVVYDENGRPTTAHETRLLIWLAGWRMIQDHPFGVGQGNVSVLAPRYLSPYLTQYEPTVPHLHNDYLQILAQNGWQGLVAYLGWILAYFLTAMGFRSTDPEASGLNGVLTAVFLGVLVWGLTEYTFSHQFMNLQFFLLGLQVRLWGLNPRNDSAKGSKGPRTRPAR